MISFVEGILEYMSPGICVVNCNGIGYEIMIPLSDAEEMPQAGETVRLFTMLNINENTGICLFGFLKKDDLELFKKLITVNGVGPKGAQAMLGALSADTIRFAILSEDAGTLAKAPGIGAKTAGRIVLDLKDKIELSPDRFGPSKEQAAVSTDNLSRNKTDAALALQSLGYSRADSLKAVASVDMDENVTVDEILSASLKFLI